MPKDNIERAIAKGSGADAEGAGFETVVYEGYGPEGVAVLVEALTDNRNRTASEVRHLFSKHGGNLGATGAVAWQFERRGLVLVAAEGADEEEPRSRRRTRERTTSRWTARRSRCRAPRSLTEVRRLEAAGFEAESAELSMAAKTTVTIADESTRAKVLRLVEGLEEADDVQDVYANFDIPEAVLESVAS